MEKIRVITKEYKTCKTCGTSFYRYTQLSYKQWNKNIFCSKKCGSFGKVPIWRIGKKHTEATRMKISFSHKGEKSHRWRGGMSRTLDKIIRQSLSYRLWREQVFRRDKYTCVCCDAKSGNGKKVVLNADHIKPFALFPELRFAIDNGRTLCESCHKLTPTYGTNIRMYQNELVA